jgi:hypothetical protein
MSWDFSVTTTPVARKEYRCQAAEWLENDDIEEFTQEEQVIYAAAERENFKILIGTKYIKTQGRYEGEFCVFRARIDLDNICRDNEVYQDV